MKHPLRDLYIQLVVVVRNELRAWVERHVHKIT